MLTDDAAGQLLAEWWLKRRVLLEQQLELRKNLGPVVGLGGDAADTATLKLCLWHDLTVGRPWLPDVLPAAELKADLYLRLFEDATDVHHECRRPGLTFLRCLRKTVSASSSAAQCEADWLEFESCRRRLFERQEAAEREVRETLRAQDERARGLWHERYLERRRLKQRQQKKN